jgi:two-component system cell cycle sensor histidine kinase/response regulator CckA
VKAPSFRIPLAVFVLCSVLGAGAIVSYHDLSRLIRDRQWVDHTLAVISELEATQSAVTEAEMAAVRFGQNQDPYDSEIYRKATNNAESGVRRLKWLTSEEAEERVRVGTLERQVSGLIGSDNHILGSRPNDALSADLILAGEEKAESIRQTLDAMSREENRLLRLRTAAARESGSTAELGMTSTGVIGIVLVGLLGIFLERDVTRNRQLWDSQVRLASIVNSSADAIMGLTLNGTVTSWNKGAQQIYGYTAAEMLGNPIAMLAPPERRSEPQSILDLAQGQSVTQHEAIRLNKAGEHITLSVTVSPIRDLSGSITAASAIVRDITAQKQSETALRASEQQYRLLFESNPSPMWVFDRQTLRFLSVNQAAIRNYGYSSEEFLGMTILDIAAEQDRQVVQQMVAANSYVMDRPIEWRHRKKNGDMVEVEITGHELSLAAADAVTVLVHDISARKRSEEKLRESEEKFSKAFRASPFGITISTLADGQYVEVNDAFVNILGYPRDEVIGRTSSELRIWAVPEFRPSLVKILAECGRAGPLQTKLRTRSGAIRDAQISAELIRLGETSCILIFTQDITDSKRLEEQFRQAQKMEAVGRLAGGVAHDFNNMLGVILGYAELAHAKADAADIVRNHLEQIRKAADRAAGLTRQLLTFSRQQVVQPSVLNLNAVVHNLSKMLLRIVGEDIRLAFRPGAPLGSIKADLGQVEQVLMNLVVNSRDAMPSGGKILIETKDVDLDDTYVLQHPGVEPGSYVMLAVSDSGCGMDPQTVARIFEPFFTTKGPEEGTGLGLSTVYGIVKQSEGHIWAYSEVGRGSTFKIYFPRLQEAAAVLRPHATDHVSPGGSETMLVVEDDEPLRQLMVGLLESSGYRVLEAENAEIALELCAQPSQLIDLLLTDVIMPGMSGAALAERVRESRPDIKVVYVSGYTGELIARHGVLAPESILIEKPFTRNALLSKLRSVLDS